MAYNNGKITVTSSSGVSIYDVQRALGNGSVDLGTLCSSSLINKYATFKPLPSGTVQTISRNGTAPFGIRTIYRNINPSTGAILDSSATRTTLQSAIAAIKSALLAGNSTNPFLKDLAMPVLPSGGQASAYRLTDFVTTQSVFGSTQVRGALNVHGYKAGAQLRYGYYNQSGVYSGISRSISINSDGDIVADSNQDIDSSYESMFGSTYYDLDTRIGWGREIENDLCVLDWLQAMFSLAGKTLHRGIVLFTNEGMEVPDVVAVHTIPWANTTLPASTLTWHCIEFLTTANVNTTSDFINLSNWSYNSSNDHWMFIPGMFYKNLHFANNIDPYMVGAYFIRAEVYPYNNVFNLQMRITKMGANTSLKVFLSNTANPSSPYDYVKNSSDVYVASATGDHYIYGAANSGIEMHPSGAGYSNDFDKIFNVGSVYYLCIWGQANASSSSARVIWKQALIATRSDSLEVWQ